MKKLIILAPRQEEEASPFEKERYQGMTGSLMFLMVETRPDVAFAISTVSRFSKNPSHQHTKAVKIIFRYLKDTDKRGITYGEGQNDNLLIKKYPDSD